jgi:hypothetical protein
MAVGEPVIGILIGMLALNEHLDTSIIDLAWECAGAVAIAWGAWLLARSPLVCGARHPSRLPHLPGHHVDAPDRVPADVP